MLTGIPCEEFIPAMTPIPLEYLLQVSHEGLKELRNKKYAEASNSRKHLKELLERWVEARANVLFLDLLIDRGAEIAALTPAPTVEGKESVGPTLVVSPAWPEEPKRWRKRA